MTSQVQSVMAVVSAHKSHKASHGKSRNAGSLVRLIASLRRHVCGRCVVCAAACACSPSAPTAGAGHSMSSILNTRLQKPLKPEYLISWAHGGLPLVRRGVQGVASASCSHPRANAPDLQCPHPIPCLGTNASQSLSCITISRKCETATPEVTVPRRTLTDMTDVARMEARHQHNPRAHCLA